MGASVNSEQASILKQVIAKSVSNWMSRSHSTVDWFTMILVTVMILLQSFCLPFTESSRALDILCSCIHLLCCMLIAAVTIYYAPFYYGFVNRVHIMACLSLLCAALIGLLANCIQNSSEIPLIVFAAIQIFCVIGGLVVSGLRLDLVALKLKHHTIPIQQQQQQNKTIPTTSTNAYTNAFTTAVDVEIACRSMTDTTSNIAYCASVLSGHAIHFSSSAHFHANWAMFVAFFGHNPIYAIEILASMSHMYMSLPSRILHHMQQVYCREWLELFPHVDAHRTALIKVKQYEHRAKQLQQILWYAYIVYF